MYKALAKEAAQRTAEAESDVISALAVVGRYKLMAEGMHAVAKRRMSELADWRR
jgi:hypothetical protein